MSKLTNTLYDFRFLLLATGLLACVLNGFFVPSTDFQLILFAVVIALTGVPHGALDYYLDKRFNSSRGFKTPKSYFLLIYISKMLIYALLWFWFPFISLVVFIVISAIHFGEIDAATIAKKSKIFTFLYGLLFLGFLIISHSEDTKQIIDYIIPEYSHWFIFPDFLIVILGISLFLLFAVYAFFEGLTSNFKLFIAQTIILLAITYFLPFYLSFAFYFGFWHSLLSFEVILEKLEFQKNLSGWKKLLLKATPFSIVAWLGLLLFLIIGSNIYSISSVVSMLFVGIAVLTLPHLQVFSRALKS
jgi:beta-carotene 15,15'-dioxygenase